MRIIILVGVSLFLDLLFNLYISSFINDFSLIAPLFSLVVIVYVYKFFENNLLSYFLISGAIGLVYGIAFTSTGILYLLIYLLIALITAIVASYFKPHFLINLAILVGSIFTYLLITYGLLLLFNVISFNIFNLMFGLISSFLLNIIYLILMSWFDYKTTPKKMYYL